MKNIFFALLIFSSVNFAQVTTSWFRTFNGTGNLDDAGSIIKTDNTGNIYVTGWSEAGLNNKDIVTIKYNSAGSVLWSNRFNGTGGENDSPSDMIIDNNGNVFVCGSSYGGLNNSADGILLKFNSSGALQWIKTYNGTTAIDQFNAIALDNNNNIYVTGRTYNTSINNYDCITLKYNQSGSLQWQHKLSPAGSNDDEAFTIAVSNTGNTIVGGISNNNALTFTIKPDGTQDWVNIYDGPGNQQDLIKKILINTSNNTFTAVGNSIGSGTDNDFLFLTFNSLGAQLYTARYNSPGNYADIVSSAGIDGNGNIYAAGYTYLNSSSDLRIVKYSPSLSLLWFRTYNGIGNGTDNINSMALDQSGNVYVTGESFGSGSGPDFITLGYDNNGIFKWEKRENGASNSSDISNSVCVDNSGNVSITGSSIQSNGKSDFLTYKYNSTIGITVISNELPKNFSLHQNYPNPFNPHTKIKFSIAKTSKVKLKIFDTKGKEVVFLVSDILNTGTYETEFNGINLSSGIYFYTMETDNYTETKKMMLIK